MLVGGIFRVRFQLDPASDCAKYRERNYRQELSLQPMHANHFSGRPSLE